MLDPSLMRCAIDIARALPEPDRAAYIARVRAKHGDAAADLIAHHLAGKEDPTPTDD